jgi:serine/threonine-protein kinase RsbW
MMELSFPSELGYEVIARDAVAAFARCFGLSQESIENLKTALGEACINAIEHGNMLNTNLRVHVSCFQDKDRMFVEVLDHGKQQFLPGKKPLTMAEKMAGLGPLRGMGLMLIMELSDEAEFVPRKEGNCFRMAFYRHPSMVSQDVEV